MLARVFRGSTPTTAHPDSPSKIMKSSERHLLPAAMMLILSFQKMLKVKQFGTGALFRCILKRTHYPFFATRWSFSAARWLFAPGVCPAFVRVLKTTNPKHCRSRQCSGLVSIGVFSLF
jgi:hypothetical protein